MASSTRQRAAYLWPLLTLVFIVVILYFGKPVIVPLVLAVLLTFVLTPVVAAIQNRGLPRIPAVLVTVLLTFLFLGIVGWIVGLQINHMARELPSHRTQIDAKIEGLRGAGEEGPWANLLKMFREVSKGETKKDQEVKGPLPQKIIVEPAESSSLEQVSHAIVAVAEPLTQTGLIIVLVIFMLVKREDLRNRVIGLLGHGRLTGTTRVLVDAASRVSKFLLTLLLINIAFGAVWFVGLFFIGVPYAFLWGFLLVLLRFVPYVGSLVAIAMPLILAFAVSPDWTQPILVLVLFGVLEVLVAYVVEPLWFGHGTGVSPIALLAAVAFWTWVWGPIGMVLSTPLTVCLVALGQHVPRLRFFATLLGDQPALEPHVSFYQRLLARDQAEAQQVALEYAQTHGQENVYDDVLLPALRMACRDRKLAGLSAEDEGYIFQATREILEYLEANPILAKTDAEGAALTPEPLTAESALVLACPAHREAEGLSLTMLGQLLKTDGVRVDTESTKALPADIEMRIARDAPALVFIAVLPGGLVQARYLCKRLRKRFPDLHIVVGYWGKERHFDKLLVRIRAAGASYLATSLLQSRSQIRTLIQRPPEMSPPPVVGNHAPAPTPALANARAETRIRT
jgi:predicted PurR-regulated permease PerM